MDQTLQGLLSSERMPIPHGETEVSPCVEGDLGRLRFQEQMGRETTWEGKAVVHLGMDGGGLDQCDRRRDGEMSVVAGEVFQR